MKPILLASASPRRRDLLKLLGIEFSSLVTYADEARIEDETASDMVERLSQLKAEAARAREPEALIIAADTDVELSAADGSRQDILGKPRDAEQAREMLVALRHRSHAVYTGFTVADGAARETELVYSRVWMRNYSDAEIQAYIATGDPMDKAAAYAVQHPVFHPVDHIEGCFANVMGLPLCRLYHALSRHTTLPPPPLGCIHHPESDCSVQALVLDPSEDERTR